jgi:hypothetical protein
VSDERSGLDPQARALIESAARLEISIAPAAKARVWSKLERRRTAAQRRLLWGAFAGGLAVAGLAAVLALPHRRADAIAQVIFSDGARRPIQRGEPLPRLAEASVVELPRTGRMVAGPEVAATLDRSGDGVELIVERGTALVHVLPRSQSAPFWVRTPGFRAKVVGTVFRVAVDGAGGSSMAVGHGAVEVHAVNGVVAIVRSGERWPADVRNVPATDELARLGDADLEGVTAAAFASSMTEASTTCRGAPAELVDCYLRLGHGEDPQRAENALYDAGWITMRNLRDPDRALRIWEKERSRFPRGALREEVQTSIVDALLASHHHERALVEVDGYLAAAPHGLRSSEMRLVRARLLRALDGNCRRAAAALQRSVADAVEPWAARARRELVGCDRER